MKALFNEGGLSLYTYLLMHTNNTDVSTQRAIGSKEEDAPEQEEMPVVVRVLMALQILAADSNDSGHSFAKNLTLHAGPQLISMLGRENQLVHAATDVIQVRHARYTVHCKPHTILTLLVQSGSASADQSTSTTALCRRLAELLRLFEKLCSESRCRAMLSKQGAVRAVLELQQQTEQAGRASAKAANGNAANRPSCWAPVNDMCALVLVRLLNAEELKTRVASIGRELRAVTSLASGALQELLQAGGAAKGAYGSGLYHAEADGDEEHSVQAQAGLMSQLPTAPLVKPDALLRLLRSLELVGRVASLPSAPEVSRRLVEQGGADALGRTAEKCWALLQSGARQGVLAGQLQLMAVVLAAMEALRRLALTVKVQHTMH
jgi:hypothetical protein